MSRRYPVEYGERGDAIQALTKDILIQRSLQFSGTGFITVIGIIQGVALGVLAQRTFEKPSALGGLQSFTLLMVLVTVFFFYMTLTILVRWAPSFLDAFLPFAVGSLEIPPAFFLGDPAAFNGWLAAFWIFTSGGLWMTIKWCPLSHFGTDRIAHRMMHRFLRELQFVTLIGGAASAVVALLDAVTPAFTPFWGVLGAAVVLTTVALVVWRIEVGSSRLHFHYGVHRPAFN